MRKVTYPKWKEPVLKLWQEGYSLYQISNILNIEHTTLDKCIAYLINEGYEQPTKTPLKVNSNDYNSSSRRTSTLLKNISKSLKQSENGKKATLREETILIGDCKELWKRIKTEQVEEKFPVETIETMQDIIFSENSLYTKENIKFIIDVYCSHEKYDEALTFINSCIACSKDEQEKQKLVALRATIVKQRAAIQARKMFENNPKATIEDVKKVFPQISSTELISIKNGRYVPKALNTEKELGE